jgi:hypothetical protein
LKERTRRFAVRVFRLAEAIYWMELIVETGLVRKERLASLLGEANERAAIGVASIRTAKRKRG